MNATDNDNKKPAARTRLRTLGILAAVALLAIGASKMLVNGMLYPAPRIQAGSPPAGFREERITWGSDQVAAAWFQPGRSDREVIVYFHGNGENLETMRRSGLLDTWAEFGFPLLVVDYPGYGQSTGKASETNLLLAADAAVRWIGAHHGNACWISAGWSLGAAVAVQATARNPEHCRKLIVMSGWNSLQEAAASHFPGWIVRLLLNEQYDSASAATRIHCPALVVHGDSDTLIPVELGRRLAESFPSARWVALRAGHNDLPSHPDLRNLVRQFLNEGATSR